MAKHSFRINSLRCSESGGKLAGLADILLAVPSTVTQRIQELHIMLYHYMCERIEAQI